MDEVLKGDPAYVRGTYRAMGAYVASVVAIAMFADGLPPAILWLAALLPSIAIAAQLWLSLKLLDRVDEYIRALLTKRFLIAGGIAMIVATTWGFLETFAHVRHLPGWLIYPLFWAAFGIATPFIGSSR